MTARVQFISRADMPGGGYYLASEDGGDSARLALAMNASLRSGATSAPILDNRPSGMGYTAAEISARTGTNMQFNNPANAYVDTPTPTVTQTTPTVTQTTPTVTQTTPTVTQPTETVTDSNGVVRTINPDGSFVNLGGTEATISPVEPQPSFVQPEFGTGTVSPRPMQDKLDRINQELADLYAMDQSDPATIKAIEEKTKEQQEAGGAAMSEGQRNLVSTAVKSPEQLATKTSVSKIDPATVGAEIGATKGDAGSTTDAVATKTSTGQQAVTPTALTPASMQATATKGAVDTALEGKIKAGLYRDDQGRIVNEKGQPVAVAQVMPEDGMPDPYANLPLLSEAKREGGVDAAQGSVTKPIEGITGTLSEGATPEAPKFDPSLAERVNPNRQREVSEREQVEFAKVGIVPKSSAPTASDVDSIEAAKFTGDTPQITTQDQYNLTPTQSATQAATQVQDAAKATQIPTAEAANSTWQSIVSGAQGTVGANEIVNAGDIVGAAEAVTSIAATIDTLNEQAITSAAQGSFSQTALATAQQGTVSPAETVQGQMSKLMEQFKTGTPFWASGAMRAANAAMASRGMGASSMASAAIVQATMEAALPIASQDAQFYQTIGMANLDNRQKVSLANAAAQQNITLQNLNNRQQAALQDSTNAFALQTQNLSNQQSVVLSNAQIKSSLQNKVLDINTQASITNAAKYAEQNKINLSNEQQSLLQRSSENLQINMSNLTNDQQTALSNLQVRAALTGQELNNSQQTAMLTSTQSFSAAQFDATSKQQAFVQDAQARAALEGNAMDIRQQTQVFNASKLLEERNIELTNEQQTKLFNSTNKLNVDMADLSNRQQAALANAQIEASLRGQELNNQQQAAVVNAERFAEANNLTFTTQQQTELYNSELMKTIGLAELSSKQATSLQGAAAIASMDMANLSNQQLAQVENAKNFLQMDLTNLANSQQIEVFKAQSLQQSILSDAAADNAAKQFNASSVNQTNQFMADLKSRTSQFNAAQSNALEQFNVGEVNSIARFNEEQNNAREEFNTKNALIIAQANAQWRQATATTNTAAQNEANMQDAKAMNAFTASTLDQVWQRERDLLSYSWQTSNNALERINQVILQNIMATSAANTTAATNAANTKQAESRMWGEIGRGAIGGFDWSI